MATARIVQPPILSITWARIANHFGSTFTASGHTELFQHIDVVKVIAGVNELLNLWVIKPHGSRPFCFQEEPNCARNGPHLACCATVDHPTVRSEWRGTDAGRRPWACFDTADPLRLGSCIEVHGKIKYHAFRRRLGVLLSTKIPNTVFSPLYIPDSL